MSGMSPSGVFLVIAAVMALTNTPNWGWLVLGAILFSE